MAAKVSISWKSFAGWSGLERDRIHDPLQNRSVFVGRARHVSRVDHQTAALNVEDPESVDLARTLLIAVSRARWVKGRVPQHDAGPALEPSMRVAGALVAVRELNVNGD